MGMQVNLREFANLDEATVLRWRGFRFPVTVTDDHGVTAATDTYSLMLTWQGLIVHRAYNDVPYSVEELVPSNKTGELKDVVYNDKTLATPVNWCLEAVMPEIDDPVICDYIKRLIHIWQNKLNNLLVVMSEASVISATAESVAELMEDEGVMAIRDKILNNEVSIDDGEVLFSEYLREAQSLNNNVMALLARTGGVSINQAFQTTVIRGRVFDLNNSIHPNAVRVPYAHGVTNLADSLGERNASGKAQPLYSAIRVPGGWSTMGEMQIGTVVSTPDGGTANVIALHPQGVTEVYRVFFKDGRYTDVSPQHDWKVRRRNWCNSAAAKNLTLEEAEAKRWRVIDTMELKRYLAHEGMVHVPLPVPMDCDNVEFEVDPYQMGLALSGKTRPKFMADTIDGRQLRVGTECGWTQYIPKEYLEGSKLQRTLLLQGLLDCKAQVNLNNSITFNSTSKRLAEGVQYLVRSLGGTAKIVINEHYSMVGGVKTRGLDAYRVYIRVKDPSVLFTNENKKASMLPGHFHNDLNLEVTDIRYLGGMKTQCITVDHPDHLYITDDFVVTRNSLINNGKSLKDAEWFHRKVHLLTAIYHSINHMVDCNTSVSVPIRIVSASMALALMGKFRVLEDGTTELIDHRTVHDIITGDVINVRSTVFCNSHDPGMPCGKCYGMMKSAIPYNVIMQKDANVGMYSGTALCNPMGQRMLSTKHFIRNATTRAFAPHQRDKNIIYTNGDDIFLKSELCVPGAELVLRSTIVRDLSDLKSLDLLDDVGLDKLPYFSEVTFRYEVEDIMVGGKTIQQHSAVTSVSSRNARFSLDFLKYVLKKGWNTVDKRFISIDLSEWNTLVPMFSLPYTREDLDMHRARVENYMTFNKRNTAWRNQVVTPKIFGEVWGEFWSLINQEIKGINAVHIEALLQCCLARDPNNLCFAMVNGTSDKYFASYIKCITSRGAGKVMIFETQQSLLNDPKTFMVTDRQGSVLETFWQGAAS